MKTKTEEQIETPAPATAQEPKSTKLAKVAPQARRVAPGKGKSSKKATPAKKGASSPQGRKKAKTTARVARPPRSWI